MTVPTRLPEADVAGVRTAIGQFRASRHRRGVIALAAAPVWSGADTFELDGQSVKIRVGPSVLAIRDALTERHHFDWVVILTDRESAELPAGVVDHLVLGRLSNLDPWPALREKFRANRQEFNLLSLDNDAARSALRELGDSVPPAPGGVLTNDHLFGALAQRNFGLTASEVTPHHVSLWSMSTERTKRFSAWRDRTAPVLVEQFYLWLERTLGPLGRSMTIVWRTSGPAQLVPLGLVAALIDDSVAASAAFPTSIDVTVKVRTLLEVELGHHTLTEQQLSAWGNTAALAVTGADVPDDVLRRAEQLVVRLQATSLVGRSDVLSSARPPRIARFAAALAAAEQNPDLTAVENAWADVVAHRESRVDSPDAPRDVRVGAAALRLLRWTRRDAQRPSTLAGWLTYYRSELSWVDGAVNDAFVGADDPTLAAAAHRIITTVRARRGEQDRQFATLVSSSGTHHLNGPGAPMYIEDILDRVVLPLTVAAPGASALSTATRSPVLLVIADGMGATAANEVVADALRRYRPQWQECTLVSEEPNTAALAALPTVTEFSRCTLLSGALQRGGQSEERRGFASWLQSHALRGAGQVLFHKADLEAVSRGNALAQDVRTAVENTQDRPVIACVLNDIDDALDRSDPIGTTWTTAGFKHLDALLSAAAAVGRTIVLVSDHGHVVERREQPSVQRGQQVSARYRLAAGADAASTPIDEVLVEGPRVLTDSHSAVLAVDEQLRYTGMKAGYHGGATLAEAVIPISILVNGAVPPHLGLEVSPSPVPAWWEPSRTTIALQTPVTAAPAVVPKRKKTVAPKVSPQSDALFDVGAPAAAVAASPVASGGRDKVSELLGTALFAQQYKTFGRNLEKAAIETLLHETIAGNGVLSLVRAAEILGVPSTRASRALSVVAQILNTDGVVVLSVNGTELEVEAALMFEQFGVPQ